MGDIADNADKTINDHLEAAIAAARGVMPPDTKSADVCIECGCEIPSMRQAAIPGVQTCFDCAVELESRKLRGLL
jgi:phage/conjugal plasmid C-4 type zinc finger TraR family protein